MDNFKTIDLSIFLSEDILYLATYLLGKYLISHIDNEKVITKIVETEAYKAPYDKASHAYNHRRTKRTETMYATGGTSYVYLCYGLHNMLNVVTGPKEVAHAILIRAVEPIEGMDVIRQRRPKAKKYNQTNGPGKVCQALGITRKHNGLSLYDSTNPVYIADNQNITANNVIKSPRVGIAYAEECALWDWRFRIKDNPWTSTPHTVNYKL